MVKEVRNFYITGGGCFGKQYSEALLLGQKKGALAFEKIYCIDHNPNCLVSHQLNHSQVEVIQADWYDFFSDYLVTHEDVNHDHWVPSHVAPHIMFYSFQKVLEKKSLLEGREIKELPFAHPVRSPVDILFPNGSKAVSFAEWECPIACVEPHICPATQSLRDWELKESLAHFEDMYIIRCQHLSHAVSSTPFSEIIEVLQRLIQNVKRGKSKFSVATVSSCHGLISSCEIV